MKFFSIGSIISFSLLALSLAAPSPFQATEEKALQECNATNPVQRNIRQVISFGIAIGEKIKLTQEEKCHLLCFLQKVGFFDENANVRGQRLVNFTLEQSPILAQYSDVIISQVFQLVRSTKGYEDKCQKAFVAYHQFNQGIFELFVAGALQTVTGVKDTIGNSIANGKPAVDQDISQAVTVFLKFFDALMTDGAKELQREILAQGSNTQSQLYNDQSRGSSLQQRVIETEIL
ncbi:pheromone/general odorant binding protein [Providencia sp. PROV218]|uniref:pheromone/general odorant binding protein n=1 Tax=Providencia sp. PROV218 TaxID=2949913 RepID=UPI00234B7688|nr:pheromone/general odorant binding protein [Providencia sp. PROV218]